MVCLFYEPAPRGIAWYNIPGSSNQGYKDTLMNFLHFFLPLLCNFNSCFNTDIQLQKCRPSTLVYRPILLLLRLRLRLRNALTLSTSIPYTPPRTLGNEEHILAIGKINYNSYQHPHSMYKNKYIYTAYGFSTFFFVKSAEKILWIWWSEL